MGFRSGALFTIGATLLVLVAISDTSLAARYTVGDSQKWGFGVNFTDWALRTGPFFQNDVLVFMYDPPSNGTPPHSVYLLSNLRSFVACDLRKATVAGNVMQGGGQGFEFVLKKRKPYYFACGEHSGNHCKFGMKFSVLPERPCHARGHI